MAFNIQEKIHNLDQKKKAVLTFIIIAPILTELLSGNLPPRLFFFPIIFIVFMIVYGLGALLIREFAVRYNLSKLSIFLLGLAFGIYNEGIVAKTLVNPMAAALKSFTNYGYIGGINFSLLPMITVWHALHSVLFPILLIHFLYPTVSKTPWLSKRGIAICLLLTSGIGVLFYAKGELDPFAKFAQNTPVHFIVLTGAIVGIAFLTLLLPKAEEEVKQTRWSIKPVIFGLLYMVFIIGSYVLAEKHVPLLVFYAYIVTVVLFYIYVLKRNHGLTPVSSLCFILGVYIVDSMFNILTNLSRGTFEGVVFGALFIIIFIWGLWKIRKRII